MKSCFIFHLLIDSCHMSAEFDHILETEAAGANCKATNDTSCARHFASNPRTMAKVKIVEMRNSSYSQLRFFSLETVETFARASVNYLFTGIFRTRASSRECFFHFLSAGEAFSRNFRAETNRRKISTNLVSTKCILRFFIVNDRFSRLAS